MLTKSVPKHPSVHPKKIDEKGQLHRATCCQLFLSLLVLGLPLMTGCASFRHDMLTAKRLGATKATIHAVCTAIDMFEIDTGRYPTEQEGLKVLVENPGDKQWRGPYMRGDRSPLDAWGTPLRYTLRGNTYTVVSAGLDQKLDTEDDIKP